MRKIENYHEEKRRAREKPEGDKKPDMEEIVSKTDEEKKEETEVKLSQSLGEIRVKNFAQTECKGRSGD